MASYDVEEILDSRKKGKVTEYLVRWSPTWESEKNLSCSKLIKEYKAKSGDTDNDAGNGEIEDEDEPQTNANNKRGLGRKAAKVGDRKRKASQKTPKKGKSRRR